MTEGRAGWLCAAVITRSQHRPLHAVARSPLTIFDSLEILFVVGDDNTFVCFGDRDEEGVQSTLRGRPLGFPSGISRGVFMGTHNRWGYEKRERGGNW